MEADVANGIDVEPEVDAGNPLQQQTQQVARQARQQANQAVQQARQQTKSLAGTQKEKASQSVASVAQALHQAGQQLQQQNQGTAGRLVDQAGGQLDQVAGYLTARDVDQLVSEAEAFARRQPAAFLGGAFALGFLVSRFLKSSSPQSQNSPPSGIESGERQAGVTGGASGPEQKVDEIQGEPEVVFEPSPSVME